jgi:predicted transcriptional regulator
MRLKEFIDETGIPQAELARRSGVNQGTIIKILAGQACRVSTAEKISRATRGMVSFYDIISAFVSDDHHNAAEKQKKKKKARETK